MDLLDRHIQGFFSRIRIRETSETVHARNQETKGPECTRHPLRRARPQFGDSIPNTLSLFQRLQESEEDRVFRLHKDTKKERLFKTMVNCCDALSALRFDLDSVSKQLSRRTVLELALPFRIRSTRDGVIHQSRALANGKMRFSKKHLRPSKNARVSHRHRARLHRIYVRKFLHNGC